MVGVVGVGVVAVGWVGPVRRGRSWGTAGVWVGVWGLGWGYGPLWVWMWVMAWMQAVMLVTEGLAPASPWEHVCGGAGGSQPTRGAG